MIQRIIIIILARIREYYRDKTGLSWNFIFPLLIILGFNFIFSGDSKIFSKAGIVKTNTDKQISESYENFIKSRHMDTVFFDKLEDGLKALKKQRIDFLLNLDDKNYWLAEDAPGAYIAERFLIAAENKEALSFKKNTVKEGGLGYVAWLFPGILGMNVMFSSLFGVGYAIVRYRKTGVLKRMSVTPLRAWEFLTAHIVSRLLLIAINLTIIVNACRLLYNIEIKGSFFTLLLIFLTGGFAMISLALIIASRTESEEFAEGFLNLMAWPMMFFCEIWFSLEGSKEWVQQVANFLPLTHLVKAARKLANEGADFAEILPHLLILLAMSFVFISIAAYFFRWHKES